MTNLAIKLQAVQRRIGVLYRKLKSEHVPGNDSDATPGIKREYLPLHHYLNSNLNNEDENFRQLQQELGMYVGLFVFINPKVKPEDKNDQMPFYLWGARFFEGDTYIKPSFQLPILIHDREWKCASQSEDFQIRFQQEVNEFYRRKQKFDHQDFIASFTNETYIKKRNRGERDAGWLYIPSGEIDHCIFQLLAMYVVSLTGKEELSLSTKFEIDLFQLTLKDRLHTFWKEFTTKHSQQDPSFYDSVTSFIQHSDGRLLLAPKGDSIKPLRVWLREWGFLNQENQCTEKFVAVIEFFYFLVSWEQGSWFDLRKHFLHIGANAHSLYFDDKFIAMHPCVEAFRSKVGTLMHAGIWNRQNCSDDIVDAYFKCIAAWNEGIEGFDNARRKFAERGRTRTFIHFLVRCTQGYFPDQQKTKGNKKPEEQCRAQFVIPILHNPLRTPRDIKATDASLRYAGYFIAHLHDADSEGNNYFNWSKRNGVPSPSATEFYENILPSICIIAQTLGQIETQEVFYNGVMQRRQADITSYARQAAAADIKVASSAHIEGSHITSGAGSADIGYRLDSLLARSDRKVKLVRHTALSGAFCDYLNKRFLSHRQARDEYLGVGGSGHRTMNFYSGLVLPYVTNIIRIDRIGRDAGYGFRMNNKKGYAESPIKIHVLIPNRIENRAHHHVTAEFRKLVNVWNPRAAVTYPDAFPFYVHPRNEEGISAGPRSERKERDYSKFRRIYHGLYQAFEDPYVERDVEVTVGAEQAFGSFMDCYLRNIIKHSKKQRSMVSKSSKAPQSAIEEDGIESSAMSWEENSERYEDLRICLQLENQGDHYDVYIYDNQSVLKKEQFAEFLEKFRSPFASVEGGTRDNRGLKEMRLDAHALYYSSSFDDLTSDALEVVIISAPLSTKRPLHIGGNRSEVHTVNIHDKTDDHLPFSDSASKQGGTTPLRFGYRFKLGKPKSILYIGPAKSAKFNALDDISHITSINNFIYGNKDDNINKTVSNYEFAIIHPKALREWKASFPTDYEQGMDLLSRQLPLRTVICGSLPAGFKNKRKKFQESGGRADALFACKSIHEVRVWCWRTWLSRWGVREDNRVFIAVALGNGAASKAWNMAMGDTMITDSLFDLQLQTPDSMQNMPMLIPQASEVLKAYGFVHIWARHGDTDLNAMAKYGYGDLNYPNAHPRRLWYSTLSGAQKDYYTILHPPQYENKVDVCFIYRLIEAHLMRVVIIDERISNRANRPWTLHYKGYSNDHLLAEGEKMGYRSFAAAGLTVARGIEAGGPFYGIKVGLNVKIKNKDRYSSILVRDYQDNDSADTDQKGYVLDNKQRKYIYREHFFQNEADVVIIHRTFISNEALHKLIEKDVLRCYITSGGGLPSLIHSSGLPITHFIGFHSLHQCFAGTDVSKLHLISLL